MPCTAHSYTSNISRNAERRLQQLVTAVLMMGNHTAHTKGYTMFSTLKFADSKVEDIFTYYYQELLATITQLEAVIEGTKGIADSFQVDILVGTVKYANDSIEQRLLHVQDMTKYNKGIVSRDVALTTAGTIAEVTDHCIRAIAKYEAQLAEKKVRDAQKAERDARRAQEEQEEQDRNNGYSYNGYTAPKYPTGVTDEAMNLILQYGYRKAAAMNHPDCGGTHEGMVAVNASNDYMKKMGMV